MSGLRVPKKMLPIAVVWAFRHGVVQGMRMRGRVLPRQEHGYVIVHRSTLLLADRVRIAWLARHPQPHDPESAVTS